MRSTFPTSENSQITRPPRLPVKSPTKDSREKNHLQHDSLERMGTSGTNALGKMPLPASEVTHGTNRGPLAQVLFSSRTLGSRLVGAEELSPWVPKDFDLVGAQNRLERILRSQGVFLKRNGTAPARSMVFSDLDHTLIKTQSSVLIRHKETKEPFVLPENGALLWVHNHGVSSLLKSLQQRYPALSDYGPDYSTLGDSFELDTTHTVNETVDLLRVDQRHHNTPVHIVTARSADQVRLPIKDYFARRNLEIDGVFTVNGPKFVRFMRFEKFTDPQRKALTMAALVGLYLQHNPVLEEVTFYEDNDGNLRHAMELLPQAFPDIRFNFFDVIHKGNDQFEKMRIATSEGRQLKDHNGNVMSKEAIANYSSNDAPMRQPMGILRKL